jgi:GT2 family glycosyltransferase
VLLSYNRPGLLQQALYSVVAQVHRPTEIIVIDNRSPHSGEVAQLVERYPGVKLIQNDVNVGYAAGMNRGIRDATSEYVYLTEDDIVLEPDCLTQLVNYAENCSLSAIVAPIIYNQADGKIRCAGGEVELGGIYRRPTYSEKDRGLHERSGPFQVTYLDGAAMFARTDFLKASGGFREEYFMYVEAVEFCVRAAKTGHTLTVVPAAKVFHIEPATINDSPEFEFHRYKNLFSLYLLHAPARCLPEFFVRYVLLGSLRALWRGPGHLLTFCKAFAWIVKRFPAQLKERRSAKPSTLAVNPSFASESH